jgi:hypothetical protein
MRAVFEKNIEVMFEYSYEDGFQVLFYYKKWKIWKISNKQRDLKLKVQVLEKSSMGLFLRISWRIKKKQFSNFRPMVTSIF